MIFHTLLEIRDIVYLLTGLVSLVMLVWVTHWISNIITNFKKAWENDFIDRASKYFEGANFDNLIEHCEDKLKKYPDHSQATWWLARAKQEIGNVSEAKALFDRVIEYRTKLDRNAY